MIANIDTLIEAARKSTKFLQRDYFELESLQSVSDNCRSYVNKSYQKLLENIERNTSKYYPKLLFSQEEMARANITDNAVLVDVVDGRNNLIRSLPYFAIMLTLLSKKEDKLIAEQSVMNFPALNELYHAEKGKGAWVEKYNSNFSGGSTRLRVSVLKEPKNSLIATDQAHINQALKISDNIRIFGSDAYSVSQLISGKIDVCLLNYSKTSHQAIQLLITEAGGTCILNNQDFIIGSNYHIKDKIEHLF